MLIRRHRRREKSRQRDGKATAWRFRPDRACAVPPWFYAAQICALRCRTPRSASSAWSSRLPVRP